MHRSPRKARRHNYALLSTVTLQVGSNPVASINLLPTRWRASSSHGLTEPVLLPKPLFDMSVEIRSPDDVYTLSFLNQVAPICFSTSSDFLPLVSPQFFAPPRHSDRVPRRDRRLPWAPPLDPRCHPVGWPDRSRPPKGCRNGAWHGLTKDVWNLRWNWCGFCWIFCSCSKCLGTVGTLANKKCQEAWCSWISASSSKDPPIFTAASWPAAEPTKTAW